MLIERMGLPEGALAGKVAVVTGAGRGIGKELARALAWLQAKVVIAEIAETGAEVGALIRAAGGTALFIQTDVGDEKSIQSMAEKTLDFFGKVDILVNNAILYHTGTILELSLEVWDQIYAVNLRGAVAAIQAFLPGMLERKQGTIVTLTSQEGMPYAAPYFASKAALQSLGLSLAAELGEESGVSAFVFAPGMVSTPGGKQAFQAMAPRFGMTYQEFTSMGANPGYHGLMPAEDCAVGFAYTIVHAREYHGQIADPFQSLARAGLLPDMPVGEPAVQDPAPDSPLPADRVPSQALDYSAVETARQLETILKTVDKEFNELGMFMKTFVKRDFQRKSGMSVGDWQATINQLISELETLPQAVETGDAGRVRAKIPYYESNLNRLADYFKSSQQDIREFIKDPEALAKALQALDHREQTVRALVLALGKIPR